MYSPIKTEISNLSNRSLDMFLGKGARIVLNPCGMEGDINVIEGDIFSKIYFEPSAKALKDLLENHTLRLVYLLNGVIIYDSEKDAPKKVAGGSYKLGGIEVKVTEPVEEVKSEPENITVENASETYEALEKAAETATEPKVKADEPVEENTAEIEETAPVVEEPSEEVKTETVEAEVVEEKPAKKTRSKKIKLD